VALSLTEEGGKLVQDMTVHKKLAGKKSRLSNDPTRENGEEKRRDEHCDVLTGQQGGVCTRNTLLRQKRKGGCGKKPASIGLARRHF